MKQHQWGKASPPTTKVHHHNHEAIAMACSVGGGEKRGSNLDLELKMLIDKYGEGDAEAIPLIFEAILKRKLNRKHEESDDEFMEELRKKPVNRSVTNKEHESDSEEFDNMDDEFED